MWRSSYLRTFMLVSLLLAFVPLLASLYKGRVVDEQGQALAYATIYLKQSPVLGTAANPDGYFMLDVDADSSSLVVLSCIGYATEELPLYEFAQSDAVVTLSEQPILLTPTTVEAKKTRQSKRKKKAAILHEIYVQLQAEYPSQPIQYSVVSDVRMDAKNSPWGMEQMIGDVIHIPSSDITLPDSIQFMGRYCKRYCDSLVREHADRLLGGEQDSKRQYLAQSIDSGTIVHRKIWEMSQIDKSALLDLSDELSRWTMTKPDAKHALLTYTRRRDFFLGIVKVVESQNLLVDYAASLQTYMQDIHVKLFLPFSIRVKDSDLEWLNLLNMDDERIEKFRLKKADFTIHFETQYTHHGGLLVPKQKNVLVEGWLEDKNKVQLPCQFRGIQNITKVQTDNVQPLSTYSKRSKVVRVTVPIY